MQPTNFNCDFRDLNVAENTRTAVVLSTIYDLILTITAFGQILQWCFHCYTEYFYESDQVVLWLVGCYLFSNESNKLCMNGFVRHGLYPVGIRLLDPS